MARAALALEDGTVYFGESFGGRGTVSGEVCFNTSMTGYQEILTDPSYRGQILTMTAPQIGNYGLVRPAVAELQLECLRAAGQRQQLMAEADAEQRHTADEVADGGHAVVEHLRVAGAV